MSEGARSSDIMRTKVGGQALTARGRNEKET